MGQDPNPESLSYGRLGGTARFVSFRPTINHTVAGHPPLTHT